MTEPNEAGWPPGGEPAPEDRPRGYSPIEPEFARMLARISTNPPLEFVSLAEVETTVSGILGDGYDTSMSRVMDALDRLNGSTRTWETSPEHSAYLASSVVLKSTAEKVVDLLCSGHTGDAPVAAEPEPQETRETAMPTPRDGRDQVG